MIIGLFLFLAIPGLAFCLHKIGVSRRQVIFVSFTLLGFLSGLLATLYGNHEGQFVLNPLGVGLGEVIYGCSIRYLGDPHSAYAHYTIPWVLRTPQVVLFASTIGWGLLGLLAQLVYNLLKKPLPAGKGTSITLVVMAVLITCLGISAGAVHATQSEREKHGPTQPSATRVIKAGTPPPPEWASITTWELESLSVTRWGLEDLPPSGEVFEIGEEMLVTGVVKNTGSERGIAEVELKANGEIVSSQRVTLLPGRSESVRFCLIVPREGIYTVSMGDLSHSFKTKKPDK